LLSFVGVDEEAQRFSSADCVVVVGGGRDARGVVAGRQGEWQGGGEAELSGGTFRAYLCIERALRGRGGRMIGDSRSGGSPSEVRRGKRGGGGIGPYLYLCNHNNHS
jgi:hypothetical protein